MSVAGALTRRLLPRAVIAISDVRWPARLGAAVRRRLGRGARVTLYGAFDDPHTAVALLGLTDRLRGRRAELAFVPVVARGIPGDPAAQAKRDHAVLDAARLARRDGRELSRRQALDPQATAFLATWTAAASGAPGRDAFCAEALQRLWLASDGPVDRAPYAELWRRHVGGDPPAAGDVEAVRGNERRMRRRGLYDTPVAIVAGQWFFAHERLAQIEHRLDELGWSTA